MNHQARIYLGLLGAASFFALYGACGSSEPASTGGSGSSTSSSGEGGGSSASSASSSGSSGSSGSSSSGAGGGPSATGQWVLGYYVGYAINDYPIAQIDWTGLTHIIFAPLTVKGDLSLDLSFTDQNGTGEQDAKSLSKAAHDHGVKALLMLGGAGAGQNIATASTSQNRAAFVTALLGAMDMLGYDGIDLDWEDFVNLSDLVALAKDLRAARPSMILTYPAGCINGNFQQVDPLMAQLAEPLDRFNVQTYYPSTAFAGSGWSSWFNSPLSGVTPSTPIAVDDTLKRYEDAGVPKSKLGLGMSFYAICYTGGITGPLQPTDGAAQQIVGGDNNYPLSAFFAGGSTFDKAQAGEKKWDATAQVPYLSLNAPVSDSGCGASTRYISYEDEASIMAKGDFSKKNGYGGIILWQLAEGWLKPGASGGRPQNALMQALKKGFLDP